MAEQTIEKMKNIFPIKWGLRTKLNIYLALIVVVTITVFDIFALKLDRSGIFIHVIHAIVTVLLIIALVNFLFSRLVIKPLNNLIKAMKEMEEGKFVTSLESENTRNDEIGWLIDRFFKMGRNLQQLVRLEKKESASAVAYRTQRELHDPLANLGKNIALLRVTFISRNLKNPWEPVQGIIDEIERDLSSIRTFSDELNSWHPRKYF
ncbi:MAG: HAMP domain-containing protein [Deltaproteobacteria bacterium]|nr:HAMP domain-containing protein [Deltaproteobacteria bacterium]